MKSITILLIIFLIYLCVISKNNSNEINESMVNFKENIPDRFKIHFITDHYGMNEFNNKCCIKKCRSKPYHLKINCELDKKNFFEKLNKNYQRYLTKEQYDKILKQMEEDKDLSEILSLNNISENVFKKIVEDQSYLHKGYSTKEYHKIN